MRTTRIVMIFQRRFFMFTPKSPARYLVSPIRHERLFSLFSADGGAGDLDSDLVRNLDLDGLVGDTGNLTIDAAGHDNLVADLQRALELLTRLGVDHTHDGETTVAAIRAHLGHGTGP